MGHEAHQLLVVFVLLSVSLCLCGYSSGRAAKHATDGNARSDRDRSPLTVRKLLVVLLVAAAASANESTYRSMQSGSPTGGTPLYDHGLHGEGQIIAVLDTGVDIQNCYFAEPNGTLPPMNTRVDSYAVDPSRRKVIAYDFLYSCEVYPSSPYCDDPKSAGAFDNHGHGTRAAASAVADKGAPIAHDFGDAIATGAKLVVQDGGLSPTDACTSRPGFGCPVNLTPILNQAYRQGARIHSNSWGDRQGAGLSPPPTANYPQSARDVDAFIYSHPDMLVVFNTGNASGTPPVPASTLSAPGDAKNTLQAGGTRGYYLATDEVVSEFSLNGPTRDGRIKPDVVAPAVVVATDAGVQTGGRECEARSDAGTSWSSPSLAGAAALVRQYYTDGFYPSGSRNAADAIVPSAALMKATIIASTRALLGRASGLYVTPIAAPPSYEQGFGFPVLDDALFFAGDATGLRVVDTPTGLAQGETATLKLKVKAGSRLRAVLVWTDPPGTVRAVNDTTSQLVNDLDLRIDSHFGNEVLHPGQADRLNNVESVTIDNVAAGEYSISVSANRIASGPRQNYALVVTGQFENEEVPLKRRAARH